MVKLTNQFISIDNLKNMKYIHFKRWQVCNDY